MTDEPNDLPEEPLEVCPACGGRGWIEHDEDDDDGRYQPLREECTYCLGTGSITAGTIDPDDLE